MTNIKNIGKELLGKSLNSFHKKTGLTQLEKNNEVQDGILSGILSQVDDAYIEKTEQSNVIHLDGSGDGVVLVDSIKGNTMVNLVKQGNKENVIGISGGTLAKYQYTQNLKNNTDYVAIMYFENITNEDFFNLNLSYNRGMYGNQNIVNSNGTFVFKFNTQKRDTLDAFWIYFTNGTVVTSTNPKVKNLMVFETSSVENIPIQYFEGLQSSFEEKTTDEGKCEIEILMKNKNLIPIEYKRYESYIYHSTYKAIKLDKLNPNETYKLSVKTKNGNLKNGEYICISPTINPNHASSFGLSYFMIVENGIPRSSMNFSPQNNGEYYLSFWHNGGITKETFNNMMNEIEYIQLEKVNSSNKWEQPKQNKIKLLINEPLRAIGDIKDKLCVKDGKLMIERNLSSTILKDIDSFVLNASGNTPSILYCEFILNNKIVSNNGKEVQPIICNKYATVSYDRRFETDTEGIYDVSHNNSVYVKLLKSKVSSTTDINVLNEYFKNNPTYVVYKSATTYEEVLNEYGEPILLEGYENGTLYIDSTIIPTTSVRYTPKMESFNTLKEVSNNNIMLTNDINNTIVPYMMEVDLMIMEKEVALMSQKNIRKIGAEDMTSMQKRTQQMLERLIKGKSLAEQECKTRVTTYLNANKITDEQAEELMLLISEVYA